MNEGAHTHISMYEYTNVSFAWQKCCTT